MNQIWYCRFLNRSVDCKHKYYEQYLKFVMMIPDILLLHCCAMHHVSIDEIVKVLCI